MSRIAEALHRAGGASLVDRATGDKGTTGADIVFFDPTQSAVVPADVVRQRAGQPPRHSPRRFFAHLPPLDVATAAPGRPDPPVFRNALTAHGREEYRRLAATLHQSQLEHGVKVVMVTSAQPREGKTFTVTNLAAIFGAAQKRRVLLIDTDLQNPGVHQAFGLPNARGLGDSLAMDAPLPLRHAGAGLWLLTAGRIAGDPLETLTSDRLRALIGEARDVFDWILLDTPPIGVRSDAKVLAPLADAAVLVVLAEQTAYDVAKRALDALGPDRSVGVVLNRVNGMAWPYRDAARKSFARH